jgi:ketosteroid isomerase-like protein
MSQENVEIARRVIDAWNRGGFREARQSAAEDFEYHDPPTLPDRKVIKGREAVDAHFAENTASVGELRFVIRDVRPASDNSVVLLMNLEVKGAHSGIAMSGPFAQVLAIVDGQLRRTCESVPPAW